MEKNGFVKNILKKLYFRLEKITLISDILAKFHGFPTSHGLRLFHMVIEPEI